MVPLLRAEGGEVEPDFFSRGLFFLCLVATEDGGPTDLMVGGFYSENAMRKARRQDTVHTDTKAKLEHASKSKSAL